MTQASQTAVPEGRFAERIKVGAEFLDRMRPGWREHVNLNTLAMSECTRCVLGQLASPEFDDWFGVLEHFGFDIWGEDEDAYGFNLGDDDDEAWDQLTQEWRDYITATREVAK